MRDRLDMAEIGAAAAAEHVELREATAEIGVLPTELEWAAGIEIARRIDFRMAAGRGVGADAAQAIGPAPAGIEHAIEMRGMRAIDHEIGGVAGGGGIDLADRLGQLLAGRELAVGFHRE